MDVAKVGGGAGKLTMRLPFASLRAGLLGAVALAASMSCASTPKAQDTGVRPANATTPFISAVSPSSGLAGTAYPIELTILGGYFADSNNVVTFGPVTLKAVKATGGGTRIVVPAPKEMPSAGEVPPMPLMPGTYSVRVTNSAGASNAVTFVLRER
jgi:hypothetical protein